MQKIRLVVEVLLGFRVGPLRAMPRCGPGPLATVPDRPVGQRNGDVEETAMSDDTTDRDTFEVCQSIARMAEEKFGMAFTDDSIRLLLRFIEACRKHEGVECFDEWLRSIMFARLSPEAKLSVIEELESEAASPRRESEPL